MSNYFNVEEIKKQMDEEQKRLAACKTKEDLNNLWKGRKMQSVDKNFWYGHVFDFIEMVGEGNKKENWKMKVKTKYGSFLELKASQVMVITQTIKTTDKEAEIILNHLKSKTK